VEGDPLPVGRERGIEGLVVACAGERELPVGSIARMSLTEPGVPGSWVKAMLPSAPGNAAGAPGAASSADAASAAVTAIVIRTRSLTLHLSLPADTARRRVRSAKWAKVREHLLQAG